MTAEDAIAPRGRSRDAFVVLLAAILCAPGLARAQDIDACIDASERALAFRRAEKLVDARAALSTCSASSCPEAVSTSCRQRLNELNHTIPSIVFLVRDPSGHDLVAVKLSVDGKPYREQLDGSAMELDPGEHEFRFEAAGQEPIDQRFFLNEGERGRREHIVIGAAKARSPSEVGSVTEGARGAPPLRSTALALGGVGVAGLIAGGVLGVLSMSAHQAYLQHCGASIGAPPGQCTAQGVSGESDAATKGTLATAFLVGGGAATVAAATWYLLLPGNHDPKDVKVTLGFGAVALRGQF